MIMPDGAEIQAEAGDMKAKPNTALRDLRGYKEFNRKVVGVFVHFEIAVLKYAHNRGNLTDKTLEKNIDKARRKAFTEIEEIIQDNQDGRVKLAKFVLTGWGSSEMKEYLEKVVIDPLEEKTL